METSKTYCHVGDFVIMIDDLGFHMVAIVSKPYWSGLKKEAEIIKTYKTKNNLFKFMRDKDIPVVAIVTFKDGEQVTTLVNTDRKNTLKIGGKMARLGY